MTWKESCQLVPHSRINFTPKLLMTTPQNGHQHSPLDDREAIALRDHFATIALAQLIACRPQVTAEMKALEAYQIADSMMRQRNRHESGLKNFSRSPSRYAE